MELLKGLAQKPDIYERLARAIAPSIYENEDVKKGILLQLFGGTRKDFSKTGRGNFRAELNILLCGDPGTSKSQLLTYIHSLVPRYINVFLFFGVYLYTWGNLRKEQQIRYTLFSGICEKKQR